MFQSVDTTLLHIRITLCPCCTPWHACITFRLAYEQVINTEMGFSYTLRLYNLGVTAVLFIVIFSGVCLEITHVWKVVAVDGNIYCSVVYYPLEVLIPFAFIVKDTGSYYLLTFMLQFSALVCFMCYYEKINYLWKIIFLYSATRIAVWLNM